MQKQIRVLHICQRMEAAGVQSFIMNTYRNVDRSKVQFDFLVHYKEPQFYDSEIEALGGHVYKLSVREDYNLFKYWRELNAFFQEHHYDIVHGHMDTLGFFYLAAARKNGVKIRIAHAHTDYVQKGIKKIPRLLMISLYKYNANFLFACSKNAGNFMFGKRNFTVIRNGIDVNRFKYDEMKRKQVRENLGLSQDFVLGNVGRFHKVKNQVFILSILQCLKTIIPNVKLLLIGSGDLEKDLIKKIDEFGLANNVLLLKKRSDVAELYQAMDVFLLPSLFEGIPLVAIEAQTSGLPCIFSDRVNREVAVTENASFLSIDNGVSQWVDKILNIKKSYNRKNEIECTKAAGYDSRLIAEKLEEFYLKQYTCEHV